MKSLRLALTAGIVGASTALAGCGAASPEPSASQDCLDVPANADTRVLAFTRTTGFRHTSIEAGVDAVRGLGERYGFAVEHTEDPTEFTDDRLAGFAAVVFLNTTGEVLDLEQQAAFVRYVEGGGGFAGVHSASDTGYEWEWYGHVVGAYFRSHPAIQEATITVTDTDHPSTRCVPEVWTRTDEWYDFREVPGPHVTVLATLDENTYEGGRMGEFHPIVWYHEMEAGRAWYTALGHTEESYSEPAFLYHLAGGILWAAGVLD